MRSRRRATSFPVAGSTLHASMSGSCFFFQAEDGIRVTSVTGVQTCALPIFERQTGGMTRDIERGNRGISTLLSYLLFSIVPVILEFALVAAVLIGKFDWRFAAEIGRASCRERV